MTEDNPSSVRSAREVLAKAAYGIDDTKQHPLSPIKTWDELDHEYRAGLLARADAIMCRLEKAGLAIVPVEATPEMCAKDWQPIETAPRDGTPILIFEPAAGFGGHPGVHHMPTEALRAGEWTYSLTDERLQWFDDRRFAIGYWRPWGGWGNRNSSTVNPTYWMPLPEPPKDSR